MISNELLKKKILDEAIHGRTRDLVSSLKPIDVQQVNDDIPFEIPNNWKWIRFGDLVKDCYQGINTAGDKVEFVEEDGVPIIQVGDMTSGIININNTKLMSYEDYDYYKDKYQPKYNDIFYCNIGTIGYPLIYRENYKMLFHWNIFDIKYNEKYSDVVFLKWCLEYYTDIFKNMTSGSAMKFVSKKKLLDTLFPVPPLEEQYKIANKIEELFELIDKKEKNDEEKEKLKVLLKEKILDSAIHGELVKNDLSLPAIDVEEAKEDIPFDIPSNWKWTLVKNITNNIQYGYTASAIEEGNVRFLRITDIQGENINWQSVPFCNIDQNIKENYILHKNDIIVARTGGTVGKSFMINEIENCVFASYLIRLVPSNIYPKYLKYYMNTSYYWKQIWNNAKGMAQPGVNSKTLANMLITVPPFEQQKKIVEKIEECFKLIEQL